MMSCSLRTFRELFLPSSFRFLFRFMDVYRLPRVAKTHNNTHPSRVKRQNIAKRTTRCCSSTRTPPTLGDDNLSSIKFLQFFPHHTYTIYSYRTKDCKYLAGKCKNEDGKTHIAIENNKQAEKWVWEGERIREKKNWCSLSALFFSLWKSIHKRYLTFPSQLARPFCCAMWDSYLESEISDLVVLSLSKGNNNIAKKHTKNNQEKLSQT